MYYKCDSDHLLFWPPVQKLHDNHGVLRKESFWRWWDCCRCLQNPGLIYLFQPGGPCLTCPNRPRLLLFLVPSVPAHLGTLHRQATLCSIGQSFWLTSPCVFTAAERPRLWWDWHTQEPACIFSTHLIMESVQLASQSLTWHQGVVMIQLNTFQAAHYPKKHIIGENLI